MRKICRICKRDMGKHPHIGLDHPCALKAYLRGIGKVVKVRR